jgi:Type III restriction enzyme, res subunit/HNH endonuclease
MSGPPLASGEAEMLRKPHWLKAADWTALLERYDGVPRCEITGETDDLTVDHRVPRYDGGDDDIGNLQFLTRSQNSRKGIRPDKYWSQSFYFDAVPMLANCRAAQRGLYNEIMSYADWFSMSTTEISRLLYTFAMVVGSGKTLSVLMASCAYNAIIRARWGAARRADRILVLCKERAIRDQFAVDIRDDVLRYGILPTKPRNPGVVVRGDQFDDASWLMSHDIIVSCIQQLWDRSGTLAKLLHQFPVIFIDEPHYAFNQVSTIVEQATTSICFGGTGSPIDGMGKLLDRMIRIFCFSYQDANEQDRSVKHLDGVDWFRQHVDVAKLSQAELLDAGQIRSRTDTGAPGYEKNFEPAKSVVWETILRMERCDKLDPLFATKAVHRQGYDCDVANFYPAHALICCDSVRFADHLARVTNDFFIKNRRRFPLEQGWQAEVVHCEDEEPDGRKRPDKPLLQSHPWLRAMKIGRADAHCARVLFVVGMGREGVNNPYCSIVGLTSEHASQVEVVQRIIGRQIRSVTMQSNGRLAVPPAELDTVTIVTHEVFSPVMLAVEDGIDFVFRMEAKLQGLHTIDDLEAGFVLDERKAPAPDASISFKDKLSIVGMIGSNPPVDTDLIIATLSRGNPGMERQLADFIERVRTNPADVGKAMRVNRGSALRTVSTVLWEAIAQNPTDVQLKVFIRNKHPELIDVPITDETRLVMKVLFKKDASEVATATPPLINPDGTVRTIDQVRKNIAGAVLRNLGGHYLKSREADDALHGFVGSAVKTVLGVPAGESARNGSQWDIPNCKIMIERAEIHRDIQCHVISRLIEAGHCPSLAILHQ